MWQQAGAESVYLYEFLHLLSPFHVFCFIFSSSFSASPSLSSISSSIHPYFLRLLRLLILLLLLLPPLPSSSSSFFFFFVFLLFFLFFLVFFLSFFFLFSLFFLFLCSGGGQWSVVVVVSFCCNDRLTFSTMFRFLAVHCDCCSLVASRRPSFILSLVIIVKFIMPH